MRKLLQLFKNKFEDRAYAAEEKLLWWEEHVRWFSPTYPILIDISDRVKNNKREMMRSRSELIEKYGDSGISLAEIIVLNNALREAMVEQGGWSSCQLNAGNFIPFFFNADVQHLFNCQYNQTCKMRIPELVIYASSFLAVEVIRKTIDQLYIERKLKRYTYAAPNIKITNINNGLDKNTIDVKEVTLIQPFQHLYFQG